MSQLSTMAGAFSIEKMKSYVEETEEVKTFVGMIENKKETSKNLEATLSIIVEV